MSDTPWSVLAAAVTRLGDRIDALPSIREATISTVSPLAVRFDTDTIDTLVQGSLASSVAVGYRVLTLKLRHYIWILGVKGGDTPAGAGMEWFGATAPAGWLLQDGTVYLRADYPDLYAAIGTTYNTGGETALQFRVPNKKGRVSVGLDASQTEFNTRGKTGGAKTHTLSVAEIPSHSHGQNVAAGNGSMAGVRNDYVSEGNSASYPQNIATTAVGGGGAHNNLQPYLVHNFIIKT